MSLLNDALRKKRHENEIKEDVQCDPKHSPSPNSSSISLPRIFLLLVPFGGLVFGSWYFLGSLSAQTDSPLTANSVPQAVKMDESSTISESNRIIKKEIEPDHDSPKSMREIEPVHEPATPEKPNKDQQTAKNHSEKVTPSPTIKQAVDRLRIAKKKPPAKPVKEKDRAPAKKEAKPPPSRQEGVFLRKALRYHRQGKLNQAIRMYQQVLSVKPNHKDALFNLASAHIQLGSYAEAYPMLKKLKKHDDGNPDILVNLAIAEIGLGNPAEAIRLLDLAARQYEGPNFGIYFHRAAALSRLGRLEEARISYRKAKELNPGHPHVIFNLAVLCDKLQKYSEALDYYRSFLKHNEKLPQPDKKKIEARMKLLRAYMAGKRN